MQVKYLLLQYMCGLEHVFEVTYDFGPVTD